MIEYLSNTVFFLSGYYKQLELACELHGTYTDFAELQIFIILWEESKHIV